MKIDSCNITSFGKFKNYKIDFSDGLNVVYGENEAGKSTVMAFIKMMFYGYGGKSSNLEKNPRKKYLPWDSSLMGGSIDFTHNGKSYRLTREFKGSNTSDKITLTDTDLGVDIKLSSSGDVGSEIFGISEPAFERTLFIGALGVPDKNSTAEGEINGKLSNIARSGDEDISAELVRGRILKAKEVLMSKRGQIGVYDKLRVKLDTLKAELVAAKENEQKASEYEKRISEKEAEAAAVKAEGDRLFKIMKKADLFKKRANLTKYIEAYETEEKLKRALTLPGGEVADKPYSDKIRNGVAELHLLQKNLSETEDVVNSLKADLETLKQEDGSKLDTLRAEKNDIEAKLTSAENNADRVRERVTALQIATSGKPDSKPNALLIVLGIVLAALGGIAAVALKSNASLLYAGIGGATIGLVLFVLGFVLKKKISDGGMKEELVSAQGELDALLTKIADLKDRLDRTDSGINSCLIESGSKKALLEAKQSELFRMQESLITKKDEFVSKKAAISALCEPFGLFAEMDDALQIADDISTKNDALKAAEVARNLAADSTNCQSYEEAKTRLSDLNSDETLRDITPEEADNAKDRIRTITAESGKLREELTALRHTLRDLLCGGRTVPVIELEIEENEAELEAQKAFCDAADIAMETLSDSFADMRRSFGSVLEAETSKIFAGLTNGAYSSVDISKDLDIRVNRDGTLGAKEWQFLSAGTADQAYLSLRIALAKLLEGEENSLPLILDDPLAQYDDTRAEAALSYLADYAKSHQIMLFTCHSKIKDAAEKLGANLKSM